MARWANAALPPWVMPAGVAPPSLPKSQLTITYVHALVIPVAVPVTLALAPPSSHTCHAVVVIVTVIRCHELDRRSESV